MPTQTIGGILARSLINPNIKINTQVQIAQALVQGLPIPLDGQGNVSQRDLSKTPNIAADGFYKGLGIIYDGDTRGALGMRIFPASMAFRRAPRIKFSPPPRGMHDRTPNPTPRDERDSRSRFWNPLRLGRTESESAYS